MIEFAMPLDAFPVLGVELTISNSLVLDFSKANSDLASIDFLNTEDLSHYVFEQLQKKGVRYGVGGYNEERIIYQRSELFDSTDGSRCIHLGVDVWAEAGHPIFAPLDGIVHSFQDNSGFGNYGPTIILKHEISGQALFSLYGHLDQQSVLKPGDIIKAGQKIAEIGAPHINGDWPPHLHLQLITDVPNGVGDFAGVTTFIDREKYLKLCPNPNLVLRHPQL